MLHLEVYFFVKYVCMYIDENLLLSTPFGSKLLVNHELLLGHGLHLLGRGLGRSRQP